ncbi:MAG: nucleotidyltransferase domain-containing protein [Micrococcales bacterium]|nr:nucleotidyltransferase domain-containing protein [Micrococcales bacterium]
MTTALTEVANRADKAVASARADLVRAVRQSATNGMTQSQIAAAIGRSQPEVSRLLHFHGASARGRLLRKNASQIRRLVAMAGGSNVRVFGTIATGQDNDDSDIDLLFTMGKPLSLMQLEGLQCQIAEMLGVKVDLVPDNALSPAFGSRILAEAVSL